LRTRAYADPEADRHSGTGNPDSVPQAFRDSFSGTSNPDSVPQAYGDAVSGSGNSHSVT
jgi:hypothetical protein